jgi:hypothetical protein
VLPGLHFKKNFVKPETQDSFHHPIRFTEVPISLNITDELGILKQKNALRKPCGSLLFLKVSRRDPLDTNGSQNFLLGGFNLNRSVGKGGLNLALAFDEFVSVDRLLVEGILVIIDGVVRVF